MATGRNSTYERRVPGSPRSSMAEAKATNDGPHEKGKPPHPELAPAPPPEAALPNPDPFVLGPAAAPTDDAPTIISRMRQVPLRPEETLAGVLRGRRLAHFELLEPIGVGGMAAVIRARDTQLD